MGTVGPPSLVYDELRGSWWLRKRPSVKGQSVEIMRAENLAIAI